MRGRADVPEVVDGGAVPGRLREGAEEEVLVEGTRAAVDIAADEVDVQRGDVGGGEDDAVQGRALEVLDVAAEPRGDSIGIVLADLLRPRTVADVDLAGCVSLDAALPGAPAAGSR